MTANEMPIDRLQWEQGGGTTIAEAITGNIIEGAEPIEDGNTVDGLLLLLTGKNGRRIALNVGYNPDGRPFYMSLAQIPQPAGGLRYGV